jgi:peptidoglycan/xylan/chitin deacetylase (PgdA/CDA1 family)
MFTTDLKENYSAMKAFGITKTDAPYFLPPYEWYNETIANWTQNMGLKLINFTPGTNSNADYTYPEMGKSYKSSAQIYQSVLDYEKTNPAGLNGFMLLFHIGTDPKRTDKMYHSIPNLIQHLKQSGYELVTIKELL